MYYNDDTIVFLDGQYIPATDAKASLYDQTLHYGSGAFEGIRSYETEHGTQIFKAREHYERLQYSARVSFLELPYSVKELTDISYKLLEMNGLTNAYIRPLVYAGPNMSLTPVAVTHVFMAVWEWGKYLGDKLLRVKLSSFQRPNPKSCFTDAKVSGHYVNSILATTEAKQAGYDEALLTDLNGFVAEGPGANFFMEKDGVLYTAPKGSILMGITRATVLEIAHKLGIRVVEKFFTPEELKKADSAFFCGTAAEVIGLQSIDEYSFPNPWESSAGAKIQHAYKKVVLGQEIELPAVYPII